MTTASDVTVHADIYYSSITKKKLRFGKDDYTDVPRQIHSVPIVDARFQRNRPSLSREGFELLKCPTAVSEFRDPDEVARIYPGEMQRFILELTQADAVVVADKPLLRFGEQSPEAASAGSFRAARLVHSDVSETYAALFADSLAPPSSRHIRRVAQHNIWRTFSEPPQDVPLALCDARTVAMQDLSPADFILVRDGMPPSTFETLLVHYNPEHRWSFFSDMGRDDVIVFKRHDTDEQAPSYVPHSAFTDSRVLPGGAPRASVEIRTIAYWYD